MTTIRSNATRFAIATVLTLATATGALAAPRNQASQEAREAAALRNQATYGAYASAPAPVFGGVYAPQPYAAQSYASQYEDQYLDQAKGHFEGN